MNNIFQRYEKDREMSRITRQDLNFHPGRIIIRARRYYFSPTRKHPRENIPRIAIGHQRTFGPPRGSNSRSKPQIKPQFHVAHYNVAYYPLSSRLTRCSLGLSLTFFSRRFIATFSREYPIDLSPFRIN